MKPNYRARRFVALLVVAIVSLSGFALHVDGPPEIINSVISIVESATSKSGISGRSKSSSEYSGGPATALLETLPIKGRASNANYERTNFSNGWNSIDGCDVRNIILRRDMHDVVMNEKCQVVTGVLNDPYTGKTIHFVRGPGTSSDVQIDHVVALSNAWQSGAQQLSKQKREAFANDPLNLLAADGAANQQKGDSNAASWLPSNKSFRCQYVARQIAIKSTYELWVTPSEYDAIKRVLRTCPNQKLPTY